MICDQIVYGVRDNATRRKLLQTVNFDLRKAIDVCTASEMAGKQQCDVSTPEAVDALPTALEPSTARQWNHCSGSRDDVVRAVVESGPTPSLTPTPTYPAVMSACALTSLAAMDVVRAASSWLASPEMDQQSGRGIDQQPAVVSAALLTTGVENESTDGETTAAAVEVASPPAVVDVSPSAPESSTSHRVDNLCGRENDECQAGPGDACAASAATEPPCYESREDEIASSYALTSAWPSSTAVEKSYRRREHDDNAPMDAASAVAMALPSEPVDNEDHCCRSHDELQSERRDDEERVRDAGAHEIEQAVSTMKSAAAKQPRVLQELGPGPTDENVSDCADKFTLSSGPDRPAVVSHYVNYESPRCDYKQRCGPAMRGSSNTDIANILCSDVFDQNENLSWKQPWSDAIIARANDASEAFVKLNFAQNNDTPVCEYVASGDINQTASAESVFTIDRAPKLGNE